MSHAIELVYWAHNGASLMKHDPSLAIATIDESGNIHPADKKLSALLNAGCKIDVKKNKAGYFVLHLGDIYNDGEITTESVETPKPEEIKRPSMMDLYVRAANGNC